MAMMMALTRTSVLAFWLAHGAMPFQANALARYATIESGPLANPPATGGGHCLHQWVGVRWYALQRYARTWGCPPLSMQLAFAAWELRQPWYSCFWRAPEHRALAVLRRTYGAGGRCWF